MIQQAVEPPPDESGPPPRADNLSAALLFLAAHHGRAINRDALLAGLPIEDDLLTVALFSRAAERAGLYAEAQKRALNDIPDMVCPAVLMNSDGGVRILLATSPEKKTASILDPVSNERRSGIAFDEIERDYSGYVFLCRPAQTSEGRAEAMLAARPEHWFWSVVRRFWENYGHIAIAAVLVNLLGLAAPLFFMNVFDRVIPNGAVASLVALSIGMVLAIAFDFVLRMVRSRIIDMTGKKIDVVLASNIFEHVLALKMSNRPNSVGTLASQLRDFDSVRDFFTAGTVVAITDLLFALLFIAVLFVVSGPLAFIPLVMLPVMVIIGVLLQAPLNRAMQRLQAESSARHGVLVESLSGVETVRAVGAENRMQTLWERSVGAAARSSEDVNFWSSMAVSFSSTAQQVSSLLIIIVGVFLVMDGQISIGALVAANMLAGRVLSPIAGVAAVMTRGTQTLTALKAIDALMKLERERAPSRSYVARSVEKGSVRFENVTFAYPNSPAAALSDVSFSVAPGERIGIIGRIGSGKTTVGRLLTGFYEPKEGRILVDGVDVRQYDPADLRRGVGFVLQDTDLFYGKIRDNIALGKPAATDAEVIEAAKLAGIEDFIARHPMGYDMPVAEGGRSLSGGQKQAIGLARVLIRKPKILFLDEPTAHFDVGSEADFLNRLKLLADGNITLIVSTHRLSVLPLVDRLLVFDNGKLAADGPRDKVLALLKGQPAQAAQPRPMRNAG